MSFLRQLFLVTGAFVPALLLSQCSSDSPMAAKEGSETNAGNARVSCVIYTQENGPAAHAPVHCDEQIIWRHHPVRIRTYPGEYGLIRLPLRMVLFLSDRLIPGSI